MTGSDARRLQEPVLRWTCTVAAVGLAITFCVSLGEVSASSSVGMLLGLVIATIPTFLLWGRELQEIQVRADRSRERTATATWGAATDDEDDD